MKNEAFNSRPCVAFNSGNPVCCYWYWFRFRAFGFRVSFGIPYYENPLRHVEFWMWFRWVFLASVIAFCASAASAAPWLRELPAHEANDLVVKWRALVPSGFVLRMSLTEGDSMRPLIVPKDRMLWEPYVRQPLVGEIVSINRGKHHLPMAHKVIDETEHQVLTRGINNSRDDGWTSKAWVQGVLVGIVRTRP